MNTILALAPRRVAAVLACALALALAAPAARAQSTVTVASVAELQSAITAANAAGGNRTIRLQDGTYTLSATLQITASGVAITGISGARESVIIQGDAMSASARVKELIRVVGKNFSLSNVTLQKSGTHLLQIAGELDADGVVIRNVVFRDGYEQLLKVSINQANYGVTGDNGLIEDSVFEYTAGIGPQYYIGGIDVHGGKNWIVRRNVFRSIISPSQTVAEFAIHFWNQSANALVERNLIINCDRAIGFGLDQRGNSGGIIRNNMIYHAAERGQFADVGIYLENSPNTQIYNNTIFQQHGYPRSIEYRFAATSNVTITNNLTNRPIGARDGATATLASNIDYAAAAWFANPSAGDLHLTAAATAAKDAGRAVSGVTEDFDGDARPAGAGIDIGADEVGGAAPRPLPPANLQVQ